MAGLGILLYGVLRAACGIGQAVENKQMKDYSYKIDEKGRPTWIDRQGNRYINGEKIHHTISPKLGERCRTDKSIYYTLDFDVTPHQLRHTYITNLIYANVDPKTVQYLAGHENSKVTMDIYAKVKYNKPNELRNVVNEALGM